MRVICERACNLFFSYLCQCMLVCVCNAESFLLPVFADVFTHLLTRRSMAVFRCCMPLLYAAAMQAGPEVVAALLHAYPAAACTADKVR